MPQLYKLGTIATHIFKNKKWTCVFYHKTPVVSFTDKTIILDTGGWQTFTTKARMNQSSNVFGLGFNVFQKDYLWYVEYKGKVRKFLKQKLKLRR